MKKVIFILICLALILPQTKVFAGLSSTDYQINDYGFGAGGVSTTSSTDYSIFGTVGEIDTGKLSGSSLYSIGNGLVYTLKSNVPAAPTFTNPATNYDRLKFVIDNGGNPTDTVFAIAISTDNFATDTRYIQSDDTIGASPAWQTYTSTAWGGASGNFVTGLTNNTTYYIKVAAMQGNFTQSEWSAVASATTSYSSLTFSLDSNNITFANLNAGDSYTDNAKTTTLTTSTNAYNGYTVYAKETQSLTSPGGTIADYSSPNSTPTTWSGTGFGYTTSDINLAGTGGVNRFGTGTKYAGFTQSSSSPGDPVADDLGPVTSPSISNEAFTITYRVTGNNQTPAGTYQNTILYTIVAGY